MKAEASPSTKRSLSIGTVLWIFGTGTLFFLGGVASALRFIRPYVELQASEVGWLDWPVKIGLWIDGYVPPLLLAFLGLVALLVFRFVESEQTTT